MRIACDYCLTEYEIKAPSGASQRRIRIPCGNCGQTIVWKPSLMTHRAPAPPLRRIRVARAPAHVPRQGPLLPPVVDFSIGPVATLDIRPTPGPVPVSERITQSPESVAPRVAAPPTLRIRQQGRIYTITNMARLQRWIAEGKARPEDDISLDGEHWESAGTHPDLKIFFDLVARASQMNRQVDRPQEPAPPEIPDPLDTPTLPG